MHYWSKKLHLRTERGENVSKGGQIVDFLPTEVFPGIVVNIQTLYMSWIVMFLVAFIVILVSRNPKLVPGNLQLFIEAVYEGIGNMAGENLGEKGKKMMTPFFITLFLYIFIGNEIGLLPQVLESFHIHITSPTADLNTTLGLSLLVISLIYILGIARHGLGYFAHFFKPSIFMFPINLLDELAKPVTMSFRLFGNIIAGEILLIVLYNMVPWIAPSIWLAYSVAIGLIQAMIFCALGICYMRGAFSEEH